MSDCLKIQEMISAMLDGELSESDRDAIEKHIASCPECAAMYDDFTALSGEFEESLAEVPAGLHTKIMKGVRTSQKPKKPVLTLLRPYMSAAACLVVIVGAVLAVGDSRKSADSAVPMIAEAPAAKACDLAPTEAVIEESYAYYGADSSKISPEAPLPAPAEPAAPAEDDSVLAENAMGEPAAPGGTGGEGLNTALDGLPDYIPGSKIDGAQFVTYDIDTESYIRVYLSDLEALRNALELSTDETASDFLPEIPDALLHLEVGGTYPSLRLYFLDGSLVVETSGGVYIANATVEEFLSVK